MSDERSEVLRLALPVPIATVVTVLGSITEAHPNAELDVMRGGSLRVTVPAEEVTPSLATALAEAKSEAKK